jgi:thiamine biosynthesis lipoprotein
MATRFEIALHDGNETRLRAAAEEALDEIENLERQLSIYRPDSELSRINRLAAWEPVPVEPRLFVLLERAQSISHQTNGAFDITAGPLSRCWGFMNGTGKVPERTAIEAARAVTGFEHLELNKDSLSIRFKKNGTILDLGAIGKGYAIDRAIELLQEAGIQNAFLHGGTSTCAGLGAASDGQPWRVAIEAPPDAECSLVEKLQTSQCGRTLAVIELRDEALSVSAVWGKAFEADGVVLGHIIDPRTGWPARNAALAAAICNSATDSDACSTALLVAKSTKEFLSTDLIHRQLTCQYKNGKMSISSQGIKIE